MMPDKVFIDSNVWIYLFIESAEQLAKRQVILTLLEQLVQESHIVTSIQVLNETHWTLQRRYHLKEEEIGAYIEGIIAIAEIFPLTLIDYQRAKNLRTHYSFSFWDSLIIAVALQANCNLLYSEDMHHGLVIQELLLIQNPFLLNS